MNGLVNSGGDVRRRDSAGFTLIELTVVIAVGAILAAFAIARINTQPFQTEGYANRVAAAIRYAQKTAISQHRNITVTVAGNAVALTYADAPIAGTPVREPPNTTAFTVTAPSGVTVTGSAFTFSALGKPSAGGTIVITGDVARNVIVEPETGYVRYAP
jgi:MSHA pilin protein MshC